LKSKNLYSTWYLATDPESAPSPGRKRLMSASWKRS